MLSSCVHPSVHHTPVLYQNGYKLNHANNTIMIAQGLYFSNAKDLGEIPKGSHPTAPNSGRVGSNGDFRPISRHISEMVQDRDILLWNSNKNSDVVYPLVLFPVTLKDPNYQKPPPFSTFCIAFHISIVNGDRDFIFGR